MSSIDPIASRQTGFKRLAVNARGADRDQRWWSRLPWLGVSLACALTIVVCGCGQPNFGDDYASSTYPTKNSSTNGLGVFERLSLQSGSRFFSASRLSPRLKKADCLLLVGDTFRPPAKEARDWMENWLAARSGRSVVYFGRDFEAELYYRQQTVDLQPPELQQRARVETAQIRAELDRKMYQEIDQDVFCRWFFLRNSKPQRRLTSFAGSWSAGLPSTASWPVRTYLDIPDKELRDDVPTWAAAPAMTPVTPFMRPRPGPTGGSKSGERPNVYMSIWTPTDINDDSTWEAEWNKVPESEVLLAGGDGTPLVTRLTSDRFAGSQILVLANAAPLLNGTLVEPHHLAIAQKMVEQIQPAKRVAVLHFDSGIMVSEVPESDDEVAGLSVLMTWPMNILIAHLAFLGILFCMALFPILGRPQPLKPASVSDFGQHAEALGHLLFRSRDVRFAMQQVADYLTIVRGENLPTWLQSSASQSKATGPAANPTVPIGEPVAPP